MKIDDPAFDSATAEARDALLAAALRRQIAFMRANVPFWTEWLSTAGVNEDRLESVADLARFPILSKQELRALRPAALLPKQSLLELKDVPVDERHDWTTHGQLLG